MAGRITKRIVDNLPPGGMVWDGEIKGFGIRRQREGAPVYVLKYRAGKGRAAPQRWITIGKAGSPWTPEKARGEALRLLGQVVDREDPAAKREADKRAQTIRQMAETFKTEHVAKLRPTTVRTNGDLIDRLIAPKLGHLRAGDLTRRDVEQWHHGLRQRPGSANRALAILSKMMNWSIARGLREPPNPSLGIRKFKGRKIERFLSAEEMRRLGEVLAVAEEAEPNVVAAIRLLIFTGARLGEVLGLQWHWIDFERGIASLPDSKTGEKPIHLNAPALDVLSRIKRVEKNLHVIVGQKKGAGRVNLQKAWRRLRKDAGLADCRIHDLRHSFASVGAALGEGLPIIGKLLGHRQAATTARYAHLANDPLRQANEKIGGSIAAALAGRSAEIVLLRRSTGTN